MELRGIEPLSEDSSIQASPTTVYVLCISSMLFPPSDTHRQVSDISSFIHLSHPQSFGCKVPHLIDAEFLSSKRPKTDSCH